MSANMMHYKGYPARVEYSSGDGCLVGRVLGIRDVIGFHGDSVSEAERDFRETIDFYLASCKRRGKEPDKPETGEIPFAIPADIYSQMSLVAEGTGRTITDMVIETLQARIAETAASRRKRRTPVA